MPPSHRPWGAHLGRLAQGSPWGRPPPQLPHPKADRTGGAEGSFAGDLRADRFCCFAKWRNHGLEAAMEKATFGQGRENGQIGLQGSNGRGSRVFQKAHGVGARQALKVGSSG